jgi:hypothetical protein
MFRVGHEFVRHVLPQLIKPIRALWNEIIGFVFLAIAIVPIPGTLKHWRRFNETGEGLFRLVLSAFFIGLMASFGVHSFLRARKISRS